MKVNSVQNYNCIKRPNKLSNATFGMPIRTSHSMNNAQNPYYRLAVASLRDKKIEGELKLMGLI